MSTSVERYLCCLSSAKSSRLWCPEATAGLLRTELGAHDRWTRRKTWLNATCSIRPRTRTLFLQMKVDQQHRWASEPKLTVGHCGEKLLRREWDQQVSSRSTWRTEDERRVRLERARHFHSCWNERSTINNVDTNPEKHPKNTTIMYFYSVVWNWHSMETTANPP